jgi:hypothetical protein
MAAKVNFIFGSDGTQYPVKVTATSTSFYSKLQTGYNQAPAGASIKAWGTEFDENLVLNRPGTVVFSGGYSNDFSTRTGTTTLHGTLTINSGSKMVVNKLTIQRP